MPDPTHSARRAEAVNLIEQGVGEAIDSHTTRVGRGRAFRAPSEDDDV